VDEKPRREHRSHSDKKERTAGTDRRKHEEPTKKKKSHKKRHSDRRKESSTHSKDKDKEKNESSKKADKSREKRRDSGAQKRVDESDRHSHKQEKVTNVQRKGRGRDLSLPFEIIVEKAVSQQVLLTESKNTSSQKKSDRRRQSLPSDVDSVATADTRKRIQEAHVLAMQMLQKAKQTESNLKYEVDRPSIP
jgi:hypothetical protein